MDVDVGANAESVGTEGGDEGDRQMEDTTLAKVSSV